MSTDLMPMTRTNRLRVPRTRGAAGGAIVLILGAWAALVPFFGPYIDLAYTPAPGQTWHWTAARGWLEVLPGAVALVGGLLLLVSGNRLVTSAGGWFAALAGAWLAVGPSLAGVLKLNLGSPDPARSTGTQALTQLLYFYAVGAAILVVAGLALGRLSVLTVRDVLAAGRRGGVLEEDAMGTTTTAAGRHVHTPAPAVDEPAGRPAYSETDPTARYTPPADAAEAGDGESMTERDTDTDSDTEHAHGRRWRQLMHHR